MSLPFTTQQFLEVFRQYNEAVWPMQLVLPALALAAVVAAARGNGRFVSGCLAALWTWTSLVYFWSFFAQVSPAARVFAVVWLAGALAFAWKAIGSTPLSFPAPQVPRRVVAAIFILYALVVYPILGHFGGHAYPYGPTFGAPCPVAIFTIGLLWLARPPVGWHLVVAPIVWAAIGSFAILLFGVREDLGLLVAGLSALMLLIPSRRAEPRPAPQQV